MKRMMVSRFLMVIVPVVFVSTSIAHADLIFTGPSTLFTCYYGGTGGPVITDTATDSQLTGDICFEPEDDLYTNPGAFGTQDFTLTDILPVMVESGCNVDVKSIKATGSGYYPANELRMVMDIYKDFNTEDVILIEGLTRISAESVPPVNYQPPMVYLEFDGGLSTPIFSGTIVPEPAMVALLSLSSVGLLGQRK